MSERFDILTAKITPPRVGVPLLPRPRLRSSLEGALRKKLLVLSAEAGYGKTSLLLAELPHLDTPVAWLSLDESDTDPNLLAAGVVSAVRAVVPDFGEGVLRILETGPSMTALVRDLLQALETLPQILVVLDDFHHTDRSEGARELVDRLLAGLPSPVHLVIATRTWPRLQTVPRLLVSGEATVLSKEQLGFTADEVAAFLRHSHGLAIEDDQARRLAERTEGWAAALQLAALAARTRGALPLEGTPREIFDYLATTVVEALPADLQEFLLRTSILTEFGPTLSEALVESGNVAAMLDELERRNLFIYRLDEAGTRYRYHQLFAEFLRIRLARRGREMVATLHRRAGRSLETQDAYVQAVRHYLLAEAYEDAVRLLAPYHGDRLTAKEAYMFREIVLNLPEPVQNSYPWLLRAGASSSRFVGDYEGALAMAKRAMALTEDRDPNLWAFSVHGVAVMYANMDAYDEALTVCEAALPRLDDRVEPRMRASVHSIMAECYLQLGRLDDAERAAMQTLSHTEQGDWRGRGFSANIRLGRIALMKMQPVFALEQFQHALHLAEANGSLTLQAWAYTDLIETHVARGDFPQAQRALQKALEFHRLTNERATDLQLGYLAGDVHLLAGDLAAAERAYRETLTNCRSGESEAPRVTCLIGLSRVAMRRGNVDEALTLIGAAEKICERIKLGKVLPALRLEQANMYRAAGRPEAAAEILPKVREVFSRWRSDPGLARCGLLEVQVGWEAKGSRSMPPEMLQSLAGVLKDAASAGEDLLPWLREETSWVVPLSIEALRHGIATDVAGTILVGIGAPAVDHLLHLLKDPSHRQVAISLLGRIGDPRARRPLTRLRSGSDPGTRRAAEVALALLREPAQVSLRIRMFGAFDVYRDGERIPDGTWKTQKVKALLKYLVLHWNRPVHQDQLIELLWPDSDSRAGTVNLKTAVKTLRQALEPLLEGIKSHFVHREGDTIRFQPDAPCEVDVHEYLHSLDEARRLERDGRAADAISTYEHAITLYRGDLLEEDIYEEWTTLERERLREQQIAALEALGGLYAARRDYWKALEATQRVLVLDRLRETAYQNLIRYHLQRGDRDGAIRTYQTCERLLREDLGVTPQPETTALFEQASTPV